MFCGLHCQKFGDCKTFKHKLFRNKYSVNHLLPQLRVDDSIALNFLEAAIDGRLAKPKSKDDAKKIARTCVKVTDNDICERTAKVMSCVFDEAKKMGRKVNRINLV